MLGSTVKDVSLQARSCQVARQIATENPYSDSVTFPTDASLACGVSWGITGSKIAEPPNGRRYDKP
jgi:hypothetical protein